MNKIIFFLVLLSSFVQSQYSSIPIEITADKMEWNRDKDIAIAIGNAKATQGNKIIFANKIVANIAEKKDSGEIDTLHAIGNVKFVRDREEAYGKEAIYDLKKEIIVIKGNVSLKKDGNIMVGEKLLIDFQSGISQIEGAKNKSRVKMKYNSIKKN